MLEMQVLQGFEAFQAAYGSADGCGKGLAGFWTKTMYNMLLFKTQN